MIKLCRVGEFASFGDLMAKLDDMEKRVTDSPAGVRCAERHDLVSEPWARWEKTEDASPPVEAQTEPEGALLRVEAQENPKDASGDWEGFLDFLSENANGMVNILREWTFQGMEGTTLEIARGDQPFSSTYFDDKDRCDQLTTYCRDYFGKDIQLKIVDKKPGSAEKGAPLKAPAKPAETEDSELPPPIQELIQTFQGEIR